MIFSLKKAGAAALAVLALSGPVAVSEASSMSRHHQAAPVAAPGYGELGFALPTVGSYERPRISFAENGKVVQSDGRQTTLHALMSGKVTVLSFIFTSCGDLNGCPLASYVLNRVMQRVSKDERFADKIQLLSLSFDRANDTPASLRKYAAQFSAKNNPHWKFLTTPSDEDLAGILENYNQFVIQDVNAQGEPIGSFSHLLRVYLIDEEQFIREVYSVSFSHPDIILADVQTILLDQ